MPRTRASRRCGTLPTGIAAALLVALLLLSSAVASDSSAKEAGKDSKLILRHSLVSLLNEVPGVWTAMVSLPPTTHDDDEGAVVVELGELRLERQSASAVTLHLPSRVTAMDGQQHRLAFNAIACEEYKQSKGKCFFYRDESEHEQDADADNDADDDSELFLDYVVQSRRARGLAEAEEGDGDADAAEVAGEQQEQQTPTAAVPRRHRRRERKASSQKADNAHSEKAAAAQTKARRFIPTTTRLLKLHTAAADGGAGSGEPTRQQSGDAVTAVGTVTLAKERLMYDGVDVADVAEGEANGPRATRAALGTKEYVLLFQFQLDGGGDGEEEGSARQRFPATLELRGLTGDVQQRMAARQRQAKLRVASSFFSTWLYPVCYLAGLYGVLWVGKVAMDRRAKQQQKQQSVAEGGAAARPSTTANPPLQPPQQ